MTMTVTMNNKKDRFADQPTFSEKKDYRPADVKEKGLVFVGHEISDDRTAMNHEKDVYLLWLEPNVYEHVYLPHEFAPIAEIEVIIENEDGGLYRLRPIR